MSNEHISFTEYCKLMNRVAGWLVKNKKTFKKRDVYSYLKKSSKRPVTESVALKNYDAGKFVANGLVAEYAECAIIDNSSLDFLPNHVTGANGVKYYKKTYVDMAKRVHAYEIAHKNSPAIVYLSKETLTSKNKSSLLAKAQSLFGEFETCTEWLGKIKGRGYKFYFNNVYSNETTLTRIKNKLGANCTDSVELTYNILIALGYTVQIIHVRCRKSGTGHVRIRVKHPKWTNGKWEYYDPAAVLDGGAVNSNWCSDGILLAYDPSWIMSTIKN